MSAAVLSIFTKESKSVIILFSRSISSAISPMNSLYNSTGTSSCASSESANTFIEVRGVFITHSHYDHIYGLPSLLERFPDCCIYTSAEGKVGLASDKFNFSRYHGDPIRCEGPNIRVLQDCDSVELFDDVRMTAMMTPGHDKSSVTFYTDDSVFTGDSYIPGFDVVTTFPRSNKSDSDISLKKINILLETRKIYPGHQ